MIDLNTFTNMNNQVEKTIPYEISREIDSLIVSENDGIRVRLFNDALKFYQLATKLDPEDRFAWPSESHRLDFEELYEYIQTDRDLVVNIIIETELEYIHGKTSIDALQESVNKLSMLDSRYLTTIINHRKLINRYV